MARNLGLTGIVLIFLALSFDLRVKMFLLLVKFLNLSLILLKSLRMIPLIISLLVEIDLSIKDTDIICSIHRLLQIVISRIDQVFLLNTSISLPMSIR
jgi:hypothetical protein